MRRTSIAGAKDGPLQPFLSRCTLVAGDMFASVPAGADAYMMKHIIHDWPDELCIKLLKLCRKAVNPGGKLLVVDYVIQPGNDFSPAKFLDLQMLLFPGGQRAHRKGVPRPFRGRRLAPKSHQYPPPPAKPSSKDFPRSTGQNSSYESTTFVIM